MTIQITEAFTNPYPYHWTEKETFRWLGCFTTSDYQEVTVRCDDFDQTGTWEVVFKRDGSLTITEEGDQFRIFATVIAMIRNFIETIHPERIEFTARKNKVINPAVIAMGNDKYMARISAGELIPLHVPNTSRASLYARMCKQFAQSVGYSVDTHISSDMDEFILTRTKSIREWVNTLGILLTESEFVTSFTNYENGVQVEVFKNPRKSDINRHVREFKQQFEDYVGRTVPYPIALRGLLGKNILYYWNGYQAIHPVVQSNVPQLSRLKRFEHTLGSNVFEFKIDEWISADIEDDDLPKYEERLKALLLQNDTFVRAFGCDFSVTFVTI